MKTIGELNDRAWYRFLKVVYCVIYVMAIAMSLFLALSGNEKYIGTVTIGILVIVLLMEGIRRAFYYTILGKLMPDK
jgi:hypothetical protein